MVEVRLVAPFSTVVGSNRLLMKAHTVIELLRELVSRYGPVVLPLLDEQGNMSRGIIVLINRRSVLSMDGQDTVIPSGAEVIVMEFLGIA